MDVVNSYILESNSENFIDNGDVLSRINSAISKENQTLCEKGWNEIVEVNSAVRIKSESSRIDGTDACSEIKIFPEIGSSQNEKNASNVKVSCQRGRVSLVRLQAVVETTTSPTTTSEGASGEDREIRSTELAGHGPSQLADTVGSVAASDESETTVQCVAEVKPSTVDSGGLQEPAAVLASCQTSRGVEEVMSDSPEVRRFLTSDGQYVYGYSDAGGEFHLFYPSMPDREEHNEKERKRRSRVSISCSKLRRLVPGLHEKSDKASVFERAAKYMQFLREKYGTLHDQAFCEKYF